MENKKRKRQCSEGSYVTNIEKFVVFFASDLSVLPENTNQPVYFDAISAEALFSQFASSPVRFTNYRGPLNQRWRLPLAKSIFLKLGQNRIKNHWMAGEQSQADWLGQPKMLVSWSSLRKMGKTVENRASSRGDKMEEKVENRTTTTIINVDIKY